MSFVDRQIADRKAILLFYKEAECDTFFKYDRYLKRALRPLYHTMHRRQKKTGFLVSFELLRRALESQDWMVRVNDFASARKYPDYPVGLIGYPELLEGWKLPNPAVLGTSLYDHPMLAPRLMEDRRFRTYLVLSQWTYDMFYPYYGNACARWHAGIDTEQWHDTAGSIKDIDFLVYDKLRWDHDRQESALLNPILQVLERRGFRVETIRYQRHDHDTYRRLLERSRAMIFLCEHESQGLAYQEAMACNVPVLAWDNGYWLDPLSRRFGTAMIPASSVPYFSTECGERFADWAAFEATLDRFLDRMPELRPRKYVCENLSMQRSAEIYTNHYFSLLGRSATSRQRAA
jgi:glycosyltransferase involved in cell wall biosynthesis